MNRITVDVMLITFT